MRVRDVAEHVVALLQLAQRRGDVVGHVLVQRVGQRRVEHLRAHVGALAELLGRAHLRDQLARDRLAVGVRREGPQHVGVPGPLLEHLRGRLDEVPLGGHAGEPGPRVVPGQHVVHQVAELVEQRDHVVVLHQVPARSCRPARPRRPAGPGCRGRGRTGRRGRTSRCAGAGRGGSGRAALPRAARRTSRRPRARTRASVTSTYSTSKSRPVTASSPARTRAKSKYGRTCWASTSKFSRRSTSA